jgi:long-subunit fatty acid transport protein
MRIIFLYLFLMLISTTLLGQTETDLMRYSSTHFGGSARYNGVAGAFGAVGADLSVMGTNPAGMARYRESELSFTPSITLSNVNTLHNGVNTFDSRENLNINSIGIVGVSKAHSNSTSKWRAAQFGFGYNKLMNFNTDYKISGLDSNSFSQVLAAQGYGATEDDLYNYNVSPFMAAPAYMAWLIDPMNGFGGKEAFTTQMYVDSIQKEHSVRQKGSLGEWSFAVSGNYNEKLYIGGSINFQRFSYTEEKTHTEYSLIDTTSLSDFTYSEYLNTEGRGINLKLGAIYLPTKWLRLGLSYHSPTAYYKMTDRWNTSVETNFRNTTLDRPQRNNFAESPRGSFLYKMRTPSRIMGSVAFVIKKKGLISVDYEMVNYSNGSLRSHSGAGSGYQFEFENEKVIQNFVASSNIRLGAEYRITNLWMLRGGVAYYQNGYNPEVVSQTTPRMTYAGGIGYRARDFYFDFAYTLTKSTEDYYMYDPILVSNALIQKRMVNLIATIGFKF